MRAKTTLKVRRHAGSSGSDIPASRSKKIGFLRWCIVQRAHYEALCKAEAALHESEARYHTTLISIGDGIITTNADGRVELLNPVAEALTGWKLDQARGRPLEEVFHIVNEETRQEVENPVRRVVREGMVVGLANHSLLIARDGTEHAVADSGAAIRNEASEIMGVVLVFSDQTAERAAHEAMRRERLRLRTLIDAMPDYIFVRDAQSRLVTTNSAHLKAIGAGSLEEVLGKTDLDLFPAELADGYYKDERQILESGEPLLAARSESLSSPELRNMS